MVEKLQRPFREQLMPSMRSAPVAGLVALIATATSLSAEVPSAVAPGNVLEPSGLYQGALHGYTPDRVAGGTVVDTQTLAKMIVAKPVVLLDVAERDRKPPTVGADTPWLPTHRSIPGAIFLQGGGSGTGNAAYGEAFKARIATLTSGDHATSIVTFCHPDCWASYNAAKRLVGLGYTHVYWYRQGVEAWQNEHDTRTIKPDSAWIATLAREATR